MCTRYPSAFIRYLAVGTSYFFSTPHLPCPPLSRTTTDYLSASVKRDKRNDHRSHHPARKAREEVRSSSNNPRLLILLPSSRWLDFPGVAFDCWLSNTQIPVLEPRLRWFGEGWASDRCQINHPTYGLGLVVEKWFHGAPGRHRGVRGIPAPMAQNSPHPLFPPIV